MRKSRNRGESWKFGEGKRREREGSEFQSSIIKEEMGSNIRHGWGESECARKIKKRVPRNGEKLRGGRFADRSEAAIKIRISMGRNGNRQMGKVGAGEN